MKDKIKKHVDSLFTDIYDTRQLQELKEEISANLLDKVNDYIAGGDNAEEAFNKAVSSLGDMSELVENLKKASAEKMHQAMSAHPELSKKHVIAYVIASGLLLFGLMTSGIVYLQMKNLMMTVSTLMPFFIPSAVLFVYFGLTQETREDYGMSWKRALIYSAATGTMLFGIFSAAIVYFQKQALFIVLGTSMPFILISAVVFIYLGLTEKSRRKMDSQWQEQWVEYYSNPQSIILKGNISGALWIFSFAAFFLVGLTLGWKYSWLVFIFAVGFQVLIEAYFSAKKNKI